MTCLSSITSNIALAALLALAAWFVQRRLRRPAVARMLWVLALVKLVTPPLLSVPLGELPGQMACVLGVCGCGPHTSLQSVLPWVLSAVWLTGAVAIGSAALLRWTRFRRLIAHSRLAPREWQTLAAQLTSELSLRCPPKILAVPGRLPPLVVPGWRQPCVLLPAGLMDRLNASQRASLLLHELVHIKRRDHLVRLLELAVSIVFWWLPLSSIGRQLRVCEEICCDAEVVARMPFARRDYASLLLDVIDFADPLPRHSVPPATAMSAACDLEQRLSAIMNDTPETTSTWPTAALVLVLACAILPCDLRYDIASSPVPANSIGRALVMGAAPSSVDPGQGDPFAVYCCPP